MTAEADHEWDEYPEPLCDPVRSEVQLAIQKYFERADTENLEAER